jgi:indolepyruvate ferredoxin oxidoreductase
VLIYAQTCATEKRRRRKRGTLEDPKKFAVINDLVCEGCGDCSIESNCLSVVPKETPFGRKRQIDQSTCNKDFSCVNGFCPSFITVEGGERSTVKPGHGTADFPAGKLNALAAPAMPDLQDGYDLLVTGVGGTGVVTVGAIITMAAHLESKGASVLDFAGFAQKFGPVLSYIRLAQSPRELNQVRIDKERADALIGCDLVVSSSPKASSTYRAGHTRVVLNTAEMSTADFVRHRDANLKASERVDAIERVVGRRNLSTVAANELASRLLGNTIYANVLILGFAWQKGLVPVSLDALQRALELNGVDVPINKEAFGWGRIAAADASYVAAIVDGASGTSSQGESVDAMIKRRAEFLRDYQDHALADRYSSLVARAREREQTLRKTPHLPFTRAVAKSYFKTLAYKDEYEVARLHVDSGFLDTVRKEFGENARIRFHLAPPLLSHAVDARGRPRKKEFGAWLIPVFRILAGMRRLRGTRFDIFGRTAERRMERELIVDFETTVDSLLQRLDAHNIEQAAEIVELYMEIRGYGPVKAKAVAEIRPRIEKMLRDFVEGRRDAA